MRATRLALISGFMLVALSVIAASLSAPGLRNASASLRAAGAWGAVAYIALYASAVVLMAPGSPLTLAGGYLFGAVQGAALASLGSTLGAWLAFHLGRTVGRARVGRWARDHARFAALDRAIARRGARVVLLLRLGPILPFNLLNYALGLSAVRSGPFLVATWAGMIPMTSWLAAIGATFGPEGCPGGLGPIAWSAMLTSTLAATLCLAWIARRALNDADAEFSR